MTLPASVRINTNVPFPALVTASGPITLAKANGIWTIGFSTAGLGLMIPLAANYATDFILIYDSVAKTFFNLPLSFILLNGPTSALALVNGLNSNIPLPGNNRARIAGPTGAFSVGGFAGPTDGSRLRLYNSTAQTMTIVNEDAGSVAANRIKTLTGGNVVLRANATSFATLSYDGTDARWILESSN